MEEITGFIGRDAELSQCGEWLDKGYSILIKGRHGIGKRTLIRKLYDKCNSEDSDCLPIWASATTGKAMMLDIAEQMYLHCPLLIPESMVPKAHKAAANQSGKVRWEWVKRSLSRAPVAEIAEVLIRSFRECPAVVFIETLEVPPTVADFYLDLAKVTQLVATHEDNNRRVRIQRLLWDFEKTLELKPLSSLHTLTVTNNWIGKKELQFVNDKCRKSFTRYVQQESGGVPLAIRGLIDHASKSEIIDCKALRAFRHDAGVRYLDMTPVVIIVIIGFMAMRYVSRGVGEVELLVMSGVASAFFYGLSIVLRKLH